MANPLHPIVPRQIMRKKSSFFRCLPFGLPKQLLDPPQWKLIDISSFLNSIMHFSFHFSIPGGNLQISLRHLLRSFEAKLFTNIPFSLVACTDFVQILIIVLADLFLLFSEKFLRPPGYCFHSSEGGRPLSGGRIDIGGMETPHLVPV